MRKRQIVSVMLGWASLHTACYAVPTLWDTAVGGNGHYYEFVASNVNWDTALANASATSHLGQAGYLATITTAAEQAFIFGSVTRSLAWISGSDRETEGVWKWIAGPEAGAIFFGPGAPAGAYSNWGGGEPNNCCGGENYLQFSFPGSGFWNDHGGPGNANQQNGYLIEYAAAPGQVPAPATLLLLCAPLLSLLRRPNS